MSSERADAVSGEGDQGQALVPKLRFPEFADGPLHDTTFGSVTQECATRNRGHLPAQSVMGVSKELGIVPMQARLVADDISRYKIVGKDSFAYNPMRLNIGSIGRWLGSDDILVSPDYVAFCCPERDEEPWLTPEYFDHFRRSAQWHAFTNEAGDGGVRVRIYYDDIAKVRLILPGSREQRKIAECLSSLDALIGAEGDRLAALKDHKKGLMQELFPAEGETTPRLRFPKFRDAGHWKEKPLSSCITLVSGLHLSPDEYSEAGDIPYFSGPADFTDDVSSASKWTLRAGNIAIKGDILLVVKGSGVGDFCRLAIPCVAIGRQLMAVRARGVDQGFLHHSLTAKTSLLKSRATGNLIPGLARPDVMELPVMFPPQKAEQNQVAEALSSLDTKLAALSAKLAALNRHRSGLMQLLFPSQTERSA